MISAVAVMLTVARASAGERPVRVGERVRIAAPAVSARLIEGTVLSIGPEAVTLASGEDGAWIEAPWDQVTWLMAWRTESETGKLARIGAAGGALLGVLASNPPSSATKFEISPSAVLSCAAAGAAIGAVVGSLIRSQQWTNVAIDRYRVGLSPVRGRGVAVSLAVSF